jgi:predicted HicB family RNase H-like nuclease
MAINHKHYTYRVTWSAEDSEYVGLCAEFPSLSWLAETQEEALQGILQVMQEVVLDMQQNGEEAQIPKPLAERNYSGEFRVRIPSEVHRALVTQAAEQRISLNRLVSAKLAG